MKQEKIFEIGAEGGGATFLKMTDDEEEYYVISTVVNDFETGGSNSNKDRYQSFKNAVDAFVERNQPLIRFYPDYLHPSYTVLVTKQVTKEFSDMMPDEKDHLYNKDDWEHILGIPLKSNSDAGNTLLQWFEISPLKKQENYLYDHYADKKELDKVVTTYTDQPKHKFRKRGIGRVKSGTFIMQDKDGGILGIYPLNLYSVEAVVD